MLSSQVNLRKGQTTIFATTRVGVNSPTLECGIKWSRNNRRKPMTYRGHIKNGMVLLDQRVDLPDGTPIRVEIEPLAADFWRSRTIEDLARQHGVGPCTDPTDLGRDWPEGESVDDFLALLRKGRV